MLISSTEPLPIRKLGQVSSTPERYGVDVLFLSKDGLKVGVQRKEIGDLIASLHDGRLAKELGQMAQLDQAILLIEGSVSWTNEGKLISNPAWSRTHHLGLTLSIQSKGVWWVGSSSLSDTLALLPLMTRWFSKSRSASLATRPKAKGEWGKKGNREWQNHLLQSFEGVGYDRAENILVHFGSVPLAWTCTSDDLEEVKGIGRGIAEKLIRALDNGGTGPE